MRNFIVLILLIGIVACKTGNEKGQTEPSISLVTDDLKYFVYAWYFPTGQWEFYLDYYLNVDKHGRFKVMLHDSLHKPHYYTGTINDTIARLINKTFSVDTFKTDYKSDRLKNIAYSGYTCCFDYKTEQTKENKKLHFIQTKSPELIKALSIQLDSLIYNNRATRVDTLEIANSIEEFKKFSAASLGEPPKIERAKFKPATRNVE